MKNWMRVVLPPTIWTSGFVLVYLLLEGVIWRVVWQLSSPIAMTEMRLPRDMLLMFGAMAYGAFRVIAFHPIYRPEYRKFLMVTPWSWNKPLPIGPIHLVWQDAVVVLMLILLGLHEPFLDPYRLPTFCLTAYLIVLTFTFYPARLWFHLYAMIFGLGLLVRVWPNHLMAALTIVVLSVIGYWGLRLSLQRLPKDADSYDENIWLSFSSEKATKRRRSKMLGWPFDALRPQRPPYSISYSHGVTISLLAGWWVYAVMGVAIGLVNRAESHASEQLAGRIEQKTDLPEDAAQTVRREIERSGDQRSRASASAIAGWILMYLAMPLAIGRLYIYCAGHRPPINLWGRLITFRWLIPGYDRVFVAPLCALAALFGLSYFAGLLAISPVIAVPITVTVVFLISLNVGPSLADWQLTSPCRIAHSSTSQNKREFAET